MRLHGYELYDLHYPPHRRLLGVHFFPFFYLFIRREEFIKILKSSGDFSSCQLQLDYYKIKNDVNR